MKIEFGKNPFKAEFTTRKKGSNFEVNNREKKAEISIKQRELKLFESSFLCLNLLLKPHLFSDQSHFYDLQCDLITDEP